MQDILVASELRDPKFYANYPCSEWGLWQCLEYHGTPFRVRCRDYRTCLDCREWRRSKIYAIGISRYNASPYSKVRIPFVIWTLGTNWFDSPANRKKLSVAWKSFRKAVWRVVEKPPRMLLRVYEAGSESNLLHVHFLAEYGFVHHLLLRIWRKVVKLKANVNYSYPKVCNQCGTLNQNDSDVCKQCAHSVYTSYVQWYSRLSGRMAFSYALKYAMKASGSYFWQGFILRAKPVHDYVSGHCTQSQCDMPLEYVKVGYRIYDVLK